MFVKLGQGQNGEPNEIVAIILRRDLPTIVPKLKKNTVYRRNNGCKQ